MWRLLPNLCLLLAACSTSQRRRVLNVKPLAQAEEETVWTRIKLDPEFLRHRLLEAMPRHKRATPGLLR